MSAAKHTIKEAIEVFDDEALLKTMRAQLIRTFPPFADAPPRIREARDRLMRQVEALPDVLAALDGLVRAWERFGPSLATASGKPTSLDIARAALKKARGE